MDDDYVAQVMAQEARESSQNYSTQGLGAYIPRRPVGNAPKPNTRFLRHLIKETDNHNTALKRKEERDARDRMRQLKDQSTPNLTAISHSSRRQDRHSSTKDSDRRRGEDREDRHRSHRRRHRSRSTTPEKDRSRRHRRRDDDNYRVRDEQSDRRERHRHESSRKAQRAHERSYSRSRSRSPQGDHSSRRHRSERHRRSESPSGNRSSRTHRESRGRGSRRDDYHEGSSNHRSSVRDVTVHRERKSPSSTTTLLHRDSGDESDPLEDLVGPLPPQIYGESTAPLRSRGRGAYRPSSSTIDAHFAADYDPALDVQPDDDGPLGIGRISRRPVAGLMTQEDDWDMALEALRDRTRWRQKGEERLRAAGMNENTIDRWKNNAASSGVDGEGRPEDVRWSKKGEGREWDRGKIMDDEGHTNIRAPW
ncbi:uncharacterized protein N7459_000528 [Penicillium hispanicum]|uniref:uncharacterized protein n=1 Tax=Penicillium hispanicum TaxID=1080232 RepID=UPI002540C1D0|nr:uncharacterized protein N7459_000528 [Penicillium hispanicum]KAJ5594320.1 hypothetical protein N7459_000528 [Penicillium hispanicum]